MRGNLVFSILFMALFLTSGLKAFASVDIYSSIQTPDGTLVQYVSLTDKEMWEQGGHSVAYAIYDGTGAYIYYSSDLFAKLSEQAQFLIIEHEKAHHTLGHSLSTKKYREAGVLTPAILGFRKETDADCASGLRFKDAYPGGAVADIKTAMLQTFKAGGGDVTVSSKPGWYYRKLGKTITCFEGLLKEPAVFGEAEAP